MRGIVLFALLAAFAAVSSGAAFAEPTSAAARLLPRTSTLWPSSRPNASQETVLYSFLGSPADGSFPYAGLIADTAGALYGTTTAGGANGLGTVFKLTPSGTGYTESVLYSFSGGNDGANPQSVLLADSTGALYGTTYGGGAKGKGTVFKLKPTVAGYTERVLYAFQGGSDGSGPFSGLIGDRKGSLYGTTTVGGNGCPGGCGTVYKLKPSRTGYTERVLYSFRSGSDGSAPYAGLIDRRGTLYGTTTLGGAANAGTVFRLTPSATGYTETVLYRFQGGNDGADPYGDLLDRNGTLYGTTYVGGASGDGTVFKLTPSGGGFTERVIHTFQGGGDGQYPWAGLIADGTGALYGTTTIGGGGVCSLGCGTVFKLKPSGRGYTESVLYVFQSANDGAYPYSRLIADSAGALYGTTNQWGANRYGTVFKVQQ